MDQTVYNKLVNFIWSIADDCLRDVYVRGKYRDVILPMVVLRRLDALLESSKEAVLEEVKFQKEAGFAELDGEGLKSASGYVFYNTSPWTMQKLYSTATNSQQILLGNFEEYLDGFSQNVKEIVQKFILKEQIRHMANKDVLLDVLEKFTSPYINLTPKEKNDPDGNKLLPLTNLGMGYVFEELIRKFNEENNEEAGEHFTPREVISLMTHTVFKPLKDRLPPVVTIYDPACGTGGMLTESQNFIKDADGDIRAVNSDIYLYGKEINDETYAICKSDMMIKGNNPENIKVGSTLSTDEFSGLHFDFMLSNPPYGKSWNSEIKYIKDGKDVIDSRFKVKLANYWGEIEEVNATPRTSDGQLLFLMEMVDKIKPTSQNHLGSRIASVHNGSSLFTGDAGSGESNIRRYIIENDLLEGIIQLPNNIFYNTGITTYIWLLSNNKPDIKKNKVILIDASKLYKKLRKNLGNKNCELTDEHIKQIQTAFEEFKDITSDDGLEAKVFDNKDFGYYKVTIERPKRLKARFSKEKIENLRYDKSLKEPMEWAYTEFGELIYEDVTQKEKEILKWADENEFELNAKKKKTLLSQTLWQKHKNLVDISTQLMQEIGEGEFDDFNEFKNIVDKAIKKLKLKLSASEKKAMLDAVSWYDENAKKVIKKRVKLDDKKIKQLFERFKIPKDLEVLSNYGYYPSDKRNEYIIYESESDLRDYENIPLKTNIYQYFLEEVKPFVNEAWIDIEKIKIGYEISFNKYFYKHKPLRSIEEVTTDILALEKESEGLIRDILGLDDE